MQKGQVLIWVIVGTLIIAVAGGTFYLGRSITPKPSPALPSILTPSPTPDASPAPDGAGATANWKTYTGETMYTTDGSSKFSIKYPPEWWINENELHLQGARAGSEDVIFTLGGGGIGLPGKIDEVIKEFPAGEARYFWSGKDNIIFAFATFEIGNNSYIFYANGTPSHQYKPEYYEKVFNQILTTFKLL